MDTRTMPLVPWTMLVDETKTISVVSDILLYFYNPSLRLSLASGNIGEWAGFNTLIFLRVKHAPGWS